MQIINQSIQGLKILRVDPPGQGGVKTSWSEIDKDPQIPERDSSSLEAKIHFLPITGPDPVLRRGKDTPTDNTPDPHPFRRDASSRLVYIRFALPFVVFCAEKTRTSALSREEFSRRF
ncbi:hypothetical protein M5K25_021615 [Dendrobium thyrsiflorum]|uniref:Uncharacterized protein n=1 Tax=Dendrobium thyrsiflorum TaxID=117978 RepID=A0ABD0UCW0_DENTH